MSSSVVQAIGYVREALRLLGLTSGNESLEDPELDLDVTPERIVGMWMELTSSVRGELPVITAFDSNHRELLALTHIPFVSLCSHHFAPFRGVAHVAYLPEKKVVGISKPARVVDFFAHQPQTQERLTRQITDFLMEKLEPKGVMVIIRAAHSCVTCRGAAKPGTQFVTSAARGAFLQDLSIKSEFLSLIQLSEGVSRG